jgi:hypothetical protein
MIPRLIRLGDTPEAEKTYTCILDTDTSKNLHWNARENQVKREDILFSFAANISFKPEQWQELKKVSLSDHQPFIHATSLG